MAHASIFFAPLEIGLFVYACLPNSSAIELPRPRRTSTCRSFSTIDSGLSRFPASYWPPEIRVKLSRSAERFSGSPASPRLPSGSRDNIRNILSQTRAICGSFTSWILAEPLRHELRNQSRQLAGYRCSTRAKDTDKFAKTTSPTISLIDTHSCAELIIYIIYPRPNFRIENAFILVMRLSLDRSQKEIVTTNTARMGYRFENFRH